MTDAMEHGPCPDAPFDVEDLLDGRLDSTAEATLLEHLEGCERCRIVLEGEERLRDLLAAPAGLVDDVMDRVRETPAPVRPLIRLPVARFAAAAALLLAVAIAFLYLTDGTEPEPRPESAPLLFVEEERAEDADLARDLARRARLFLAAAEQAPVETLGAELQMSGLGLALTDVDLAALAPADREAVRRVMLLGEAWRNDAPVARAEIAMLTEGLR